MATRFTPATIIDVGASDGQWLRMAHEVWPEAKLLLIEANPVFRDQMFRMLHDYPSAQFAGKLCGDGSSITKLVRFAGDDPFQGVYEDDGADDSLCDALALTKRWAATACPAPTSSSWMFTAASTKSCGARARP